MENKVLNFIKENSMLEKDERVLIALSGGPDSVCLLHILHKLREKLGIKIYAAHVNHCLRGEEALNDEIYSRNLCDSLGIPFYCKHVDINRLAKEQGVSTEMAGRDARYVFFDELKNNIGIDKIAIAHNANDQAETLIMRAIRGTGIEGLVGIRPVRDKIYIRPILCLTRKEIEEYCSNEQLKPCIDKSNLEEIYSRNKVRLKVIPYLEKYFNSDLVAALNRLSHNCSKDVEFIEYIVNEKYNKYCIKKNNYIIISKDAFKEKEAIITRIIKKALVEVSSICNNFEMKHIYDIVTLQNGNSGKRINITNGVIAVNEYGDIRLKLKENLEIDEEEIVIDVKKQFNDGKHSILNSNHLGEIIIEKVNKSDNKQFDKDDFIKYFDYEKASKIIIRGRKDGDKITPLGMKGSKKLKDIFIDSKVPKDLRDSVPIIVFNDEIAWVVGFRVSDKFKVTKDTKIILKITVIRKEQ